MTPPPRVDAPALINRGRPDYEGSPAHQKGTQADRLTALELAARSQGTAAATKAHALSDHECTTIAAGCYPRDAVVRQHQFVTTSLGVGIRRRHLLVGIAAAAAIALLIVWLLTPNAARDVRADRPTASLVAANCPTTGAELMPWTSGDITGVNVGSIPNDFWPRSVLLCSIDREASGEGETSRYTVTTSEAPVSGDFLSALELPDQVFWFDSRGACTADAEAPLDLLLLDAQRQAVRPAVPMVPCAKIRPEVRKAIAAAPLVVTSRRIV